MALMLDRPTLVETPALLRLLPARLQTSAFFRLYWPSARKSTGVWERRGLTFAPGARMLLVPTDIAHAEIGMTGHYELRLSRLIVEHARAGGVLVDVGANAGYFSQLWLAQRSENRVVAFEASPRNADLFRANVGINASDSRVTFHACAAGASRGRIAFVLGPEDQTGWGGIAAGTMAGDCEVDVITLDEALAGTRVSVLKIDVEGAEALVLAGASATLADSAPIVFFEQNTPRLRALGLADDQAVRLLERHGYACRTLTDPTSDVVEWIAEPKAARPRAPLP